MLRLSAMSFLHRTSEADQIPVEILDLEISHPVGIGLQGRCDFGARCRDRDVTGIDLVAVDITPKGSGRLLLGVVPKI
jgi:hypothetical protein